MNGANVERCDCCGTTGAKMPGTLTSESLPRPVLFCKVCTDQEAMPVVRYAELRGDPSVNHLYARCLEHGGAP